MVVAFGTGMFTSGDLDEDTGLIVEEILELDKSSRGMFEEEVLARFP